VTASISGLSVGIVTTLVAAQQTIAADGIEYIARAMPAFLYRALGRAAFHTVTGLSTEMIALHQTVAASREAFSQPSTL